MKKSNLIIIIIFCFFIYAPTIIYWFVSDKMDNQNYENRELYTKPDFTFQNILNFPSQYEKYFNDHMAFKNEIRKLRSSILYNVFSTSSTSRVIYGKDGWLFYNSKASESVDNIEDYRKLSVFSDIEKEQIKNSLTKTKNVLSSKGIQFYVWILPNKENIYFDYMPNLISRNDENQKSKTEDLIDYLEKNTDLSVIYSKDALVEGRKHEDTYYKFDTHWNNYGSYLGVIDLMKKMNPNFNINENITWGDNTRTGDLANMLTLSDELIENDKIAQNFLSDITYKCVSGKEFKECTSNGKYNQTILVIGDSFRHATVQYLAKIYNKAIFIHRDYYNEDLIKKYSADIVVYEVVERLSKTLKNADKILY